MIGARLLVWMIAVVALLVPPGLAVHAKAAAGHVATVDCPGHAPPPDPCPEQDKAKHAAGVCCPLMSGAVALLPATVANAAVASSHALPRFDCRASSDVSSHRIRRLPESEPNSFGSSPDAESHDVVATFDRRRPGVGNRRAGVGPWTRPQRRPAGRSRQGHPHHRGDRHRQRLLVEALDVSDGETVRFVVRNDGRDPHELTIGTMPEHAEHRRQMKAMMEMMKKGGHDGHSMADIAHEGGVWVDPGKTASFVWTFARTADLEFACNIQGHYEDGMKGAIRFGK